MRAGTTGPGDVAARLADSTVLVTGASGFVGKAVLNQLLWGTEGVRVRVLLRSKDKADAHRRLVEEILEADPFRSAPVEMVDQMVRDREIEAISGDLGDDGLAARVKEQLGGIDTVIHCAASVSFEEPLDGAMRINGYGPARLAAALKAAGSEPHFVHVSTAYTADCRVPVVAETDTHPGLAKLDPAEVLERAQGWRKQVEADAAKGGKDERWIDQRLSERGRAFAGGAGWPDTYSMTKAIGEMLLLRESAKTTIVRPSIVESALLQPRPGWLEGFKVADPLIIAYASRGLTHLPGRADNPIDLVPVDCVANACVTAAAYPPAESSPARSPSPAAPATPSPWASSPATPATTSAATRWSAATAREIRIGDLRFSSRGRALLWSRGREELLGLGARAAVLPARPPRPAGPAAQQQARRTGPADGRDLRALHPAQLPLRRHRRPGAARRVGRGGSRPLLLRYRAIDWTDYLETVHMPRLREMVAEGFAGGNARPA